jgi:hypothetical protein
MSDSAKGDAAQRIHDLEAAVGAAEARVEQQRHLAATAAVAADAAAAQTAEMNAAAAGDSQAITRLANQHVHDALDQSAARKLAIARRLFPEPNHHEES